MANRQEIVGVSRGAKIVVFESDTYLNETTYETVELEKGARSIMILDRSGDAYITLTKEQVEQLKAML